MSKHDEFTEDNEGNLNTDKVISGLSDLSNKIDQSARAEVLLNDPDVQKIMAARQRGQEINVVEKSPERLIDEFKMPAKQGDSNFDYEDYTGQEFEAHLLSKVQEVVGPMMNKAFEQITGRLGTLQSRLDQEEMVKIKRDVAKFKSTHSDFDSYVPAMKELSILHPGLGVEQLYRLANPNATNEVTQEQVQQLTGVESEKPSNTSARKGTKPIKMESGSRGFADALDEVLNE